MHLSLKERAHHESTIASNDSKAGSVGFKYSRKHFSGFSIDVTFFD